MKTYLIAVAVVLLGLMGQASAADEFKLAMKSGCLVCHRGVDDRIGPPFAAIAKKYNCTTAELVCRWRVLFGGWEEGHIADVLLNAGNPPPLPQSQTVTSAFNARI